MTDTKHQPKVISKRQLYKIIEAKIMRLDRKDKDYESKKNEIVEQTDDPQF
jgi:hypothetical protein